MVVILVAVVVAMAVALFGGAVVDLTSELADGGVMEAIISPLLTSEIRRSEDPRKFDVAKSQRVNQRVN